MIGTGKIHLTPSERAEYGALCALELQKAQKKAKRKKKGWTPPPFIDFDRMAIETHPTLQSRFFCIENTWDEKRRAEFVRGERKKAELSEIERSEIASAAPPQRAGNNSLVSTRKSPTQDKSLNKRPPVARFYHREWSGEYRVSIESMTRQIDAPPPQAGERFTDALTDRAARNIIDSGAYMAAKKGGYSTFLTLTFDSETRKKINTIVAVEGERAAAGECSNGIKAEGEFTRIDWQPLTTIGREVSRFTDALQKKYQRGWYWQPSESEQAEMLPVWESEYMPPQYVGSKPSAVGAKPIAKKINYCWVAENPDKIEKITNSIGEIVEVKTGENPHVHMLLDWQVSKLHFKVWAEQIESLWGNGFAKLEKIRDSRAASTYLMKALGYLTKGTAKVNKNTGEIYNSQGRVRGNRYGISSGARAPKWECIAEYDAEIMSRFVADIGQKIKQKQDALKAQIQNAKAEVKAQVKAREKAKFNRRVPEQKRAAAIIRAEKMINRLETTIKKMSESRYKNAHANKYKITFRAKKQLNAFIERAITHAGWGASILDHAKETVISEAKRISQWAKGAGRAVYESIQNEKNQQELWWQQVMHDPIPPEPDNLIVII